MQTLLNNESHKQMTALSFIKLHKKEQDFYIFLTIIVAFLDKIHLSLKYHALRYYSFISPTM